MARNPIADRIPIAVDTFTGVLHDGTTTGVEDEILLPSDLGHIERAEAVVRQAAERFGAERLALAASWQKETAVMVDLVQRVAPGARIFTLDTGALFLETYVMWRETEQRYGIEVESFRGEWIDGLWATDPERCCSMRKVEPLERALEGAACWLSGLRRDQSASRAGTPELAWDPKHGLHKANPLATWTDSDVWAYITAHDLPYNQLHDRGYESIGCTHCTLPGTGREGRWVGSEKTECGLHLPAAS
jgi:phosphoadenosine phosphosulfate reductase